MTINILAIGDVVGQTGLAFLKEHLKPLQKLKGVSFTVVNGENANVVGITPAQADAILAAGADVVTLGNHTWTRTELRPYLDERRKILRPANCAPQCPGRGIDVYKTSFGDVCVMNLMGHFTLDTNTDNPFVIADGYMEEIREKSMIYEGLKHYFIVNFPQRSGAILSFVRDVIGPTDDLVYIQYIRKTNKEEGPALIGIEVASKDDFKALIKRMNANNITYEYINENNKLFEILI